MRACAWPGCQRGDVGDGSKCEDLRVTKSSPLCPKKLTLVTCAATSLMGHKAGIVEKAAN